MLKIIVVDSSTLISLAKIDASFLLEQIDARLICPSEIYAECVEEGWKRGYMDALIIKRLFDQQIVLQESVSKREMISGLSIGDSLIIRLAKEKEAEFIFTDDDGLEVKASGLNLKTRRSADILLKMYLSGKISKQSYTQLIQQLGNKKRLDKEKIEIYLKRVEEGGKNGRENG